MAVGKRVGHRFLLLEAWLMSVISKWIERIRVLFWPASRRKSMLLAPPVIAELLPDVPGGEPNLLPSSAWLVPLRVDFPMWQNSEPTPGDPEYLRVYWNDLLLEEKVWTKPVQPVDLFIMIAQQYLGEGQHRLRYSVETANQVQTESETLAFVIDKTAPVFADEGALIFPEEIIRDGLTSAWLDSHGNTVLAEVPAYFSPSAGDLIIWYWSSTLTGSEHTGTLTLEASDIGSTINIAFDKQMVLESGDGIRYVSYRLKDRSGNAGPRALAVSLLVRAQPVPRVLPPPRVQKASGSASASTLDPLDAYQGAVVSIPESAVIAPGDTVRVQWAEPGSVGAFLTEVADSRLFNIPSTQIAQHFGKSIPVYYEVFEKSAAPPYLSDLHTLSIMVMTGFPVVQCDKVSGGRLSLQDIAEGGYARFTLDSWSFMGTDQFLTIEVHGVSSADNELLTIGVLDEYPVPRVDDKIDAGVISKTDLQAFQVGTQLDVRVRVSFDQTHSWQPFPPLRTTLYA
ncbi:MULTISPECIES: hypothetical protein [Pseudomonas syringae group]|jgi:hypothetical protein|uniref:hypothetical protein n=1 Tax=Pseudomonas syringae group TaxID=136849 RepID=UPI000BB6082D|nr:MULTISPECIES: hypothetical protein [Pseudomonas syringae group]MCH5651061.1 hypothetical protein [Pseudomonas syringae]MCK9690845.1 hypothetical protein [Pseudomonas syringae pv. syringae]MCK9776085.1 hypothetical protein [Pseudomonas syringae pv. syringae]MCZ0948929.1 hypothetical protein [Pseudomonas syringae pv. tomato]PBP88427.1 hypothetical protein CCL20_10220 [Pseudomonas syringae]